MPTRMKESDRVRGSNRMRVIIADARYHNGLICPYCNETISGLPHVDHIIARRHGGDIKEFDNLVTCCASCNGRKCDTDVAQIFGIDIEQKVNTQIKNRVLTKSDHQAAIDIYKCGKSQSDRIEMILDWVLGGLLPIRLR